MTTQPQEDGSEHRCANRGQCVGKSEGKPRITEQPHTLCRPCLGRSTKRVSALPEQWVRLHHMIGDRHAGVDVNIRRPKPSGTVLLNIHVDTLLGAICDATLTAAEVLADRMGLKDKNGQPRNLANNNLPEQVHSCCKILAPNMHRLAAITGVGGRDDTDPAIDVMFWVKSGYAFGVKCTTGVQMIQRLDHLGSLAYFTLGQTRARTRRDMPCTRCRAKTVGRWAGSDWFDCSTCGSQFPEDELRRQDKILIELHKRGLLNQESA